jgi:hypothetical protein
MHGIIRRRLLVNALVDPDEAARRLPAGVRPHVIEGGTVVGCCLLDIDRIRPAPLPSVLGMRLRAAAHRVSVEWDDGFGGTTVGVYVPVRHTDSRAAMLLGGRWFPGVHRPADLNIVESTDRLCWTVTPAAEAIGFGVRVIASITEESPSTPCEAIGGTCLSAAVGVSPDHHGLLEAAEMRPHRRHAQQVVIDDLESEFLASFATARSAPSYLMRDVGVTWTRGSPPRIAAVRVPA